MTTLQPKDSIISQGAHDALVDQLRACKSAHEILEFEKWFNSNSSGGPLHELICELLKNRSISRVLAAKWLSTLLKDKENKINKLF